MWGLWLADSGLDLHIVHPYTGEALPSRVEDFDGFLVLGGSPGPLEDDRYPWLPATRALLRQAVEGDVPTFGICLGAELLAVTFDGSIARRATPQVGIHSLKALPTTADDPVFAGTADDLPALLWHQEELTVLPDQAVLLLTGTDAPFQAFRLGRHAWGTQFHPEADLRTVTEWSCDSALLKRSGKQPHEILSQIDQARADTDRIWSRTARRWAALIQDRHTEPTAAAAH
jgi:GMP synthase-like glutamine amidotransferase